LEHVVNGIERLETQTRIDLLLGLQNEVDGMDAVIVDLAGHEAANVLIGHRSPPGNGM
jgi:hypothetical protein